MNYRFSFRRYRLPLRAAVRTAHGVWTEREGVIVRLTSSTSSTSSPRANLERTPNRKEEGGSKKEDGWGEAAVIPWFGTETADEAEAACRELGDRVDDARLDAVPTRLRCLRNAIASARIEVWPGFSPPAMVPSKNENGRAEAPPYLPVAALLPAGRAVLAEIRPKAESGFRVFKWKVGVGDIADELALLDDVCAGLPSGAKLRLDANGAWDRRKAERWLERCAERPVEFLEQPIATDACGAEDLLLGLANDFPTPLALDESLAGDGDVERWLGAGWPGVFVVKPSLLGDAAGALEKLAAYCAKASKAEAVKGGVVFSSALETAVGARSALRMAFAWRGQPDSAHSTGSGQAGSPQARALGFGVWPLFADARFDGPAAAPFLRWEDVERINPEAAWNALG